MTIKLGDKARDRVTGVEGIVIAEHQWLYGCKRVTIQPQEIKDGKPADPYTVDEPQCELLEHNAIGLGEAETKEARLTGGPRTEPAQRSEPSRR